MADDGGDVARTAPEVGETELAVTSGRSRRTVAVVAGAVALVAALFVVLLATRDTSSGRESETPLQGEVAPPVTGVALDGTRFDLADQRGRWVVVNFFASWCVPCQNEHPELVDFAERHRATGDAEVVSVAFADRPEAVAEFFETNGGDWPVLVDDTGPIAVAWGVTGVPESYVVAPNGVVVTRITGGVEAAYLDEVIDQLSGTSAPTGGGS